MALTKITSTNIGANAVTSSAIGYTPANKAGDTFTGTISITPAAIGNKLLTYDNSNYRYGIAVQSAEHRIFAASDGATTIGNVSSDVNYTFTERMRISPSGFVTTPFQPAFRATNNNTSQSLVSNTEAVVQYNVAETNVGNHYNTSTYRFTAPVSGFYHFSASILVTKSSSTRIDIIFRKNTVAWVSGEVQGLTTASTNSMVCNSMDGYLTAGDYVDVTTRINDNGSIYQEPKFWNFSGFLIG